MKNNIKYNKHFCQNCGHDRKLVGQIMWDEVIIDVENNEEEYIGLTDDFENSGKVICANCNNDWTGEDLPTKDDMEQFEK